MPGLRPSSQAGILTALTKRRAADITKAQVRDFWNAQSCGTEATTAAKFTREYFEEVEAFRYYDQPFIHSFAQFTRFHGRKVLEVGLARIFHSASWFWLIRGSLVRKTGVTGGFVQVSRGARRKGTFRGSKPLLFGLFRIHSSRGCLGSTVLGDSAATLHPVAGAKLINRR